MCITNGIEFLGVKLPYKYIVQARLGEVLFRLLGLGRHPLDALLYRSGLVQTLIYAERRDHALGASADDGSVGGFRDFQCGL